MCIRDRPDSVMDIVDSIGLDAFKELVRLAGGSNLYIPNESSLVKSFRNKKIREVFDGEMCIRDRISSAFNKSCINTSP